MAPPCLLLLAKTLRQIAAKHLCKDIDVSSKATDSLKQNLRYFVLFLHQLKYVFLGFRAFYPVFFYIAFSGHIVFVCLVFCLSVFTQFLRSIRVSVLAAQQTLVL